jgi:anti-sigma28 factor (negative regulator of flagellin synthesis)
MLYPISSPSSADPVKRPLTSRRVVTEKSVAGSPPGGAADTIDVAKTAALLAAIVDAAAVVPGVDQDRIAQLQQAVASGTFGPHPRQILQSIVEFEAQLFG